MALPNDRPSREPIRVDATVAEVLPQALFRVRMDDGRLLTAHVAEDLRLRCVRVLPGDRVLVELTTYDASRGRIVRRGGPSAAPRGPAYES